MDWTALEWIAPGAEDDSLTAFLGTNAPLIRSALDEAAAAAILGPAVIVRVESAVCPASELPAGFVPAATFELLGTSRRPLAVALDATLGAELAGTAIAAGDIGTALLGALDEVLVALVGEGLSLGGPDGLPADEELLLVRICLASGADADVAPEVAVVVAVALAARVEMVTHLRALETLGAGPVAEPSGDAATEGTEPGAPAPAAGGAGDASIAVPGPAMAAGSAQARVPAGTAETGPQGTAAIRPAQFAPLTPGPTMAGRQSLDLLLGVNLEVSVEIGRARMMIRDVLSLTPGSIVELDKLAGEKVDVLVNRHHVATGEVVVVDENFGVRITEIVARDRRLTPMEGRA